MEWLITIFLFFAVIIIAAVLFTGWLVVATVAALVRGLKRGVGFLLGRPTKHGGASPNTVTCMRPRCQAENPLDARFCRRCGRMLPQPQQVAVRRVATL